MYCLAAILLRYAGLSPILGFSVSSIYENISYLLSLRPVGRLPLFLSKVSVNLLSCALNGTAPTPTVKIVIIDTSQTMTGPDIGEPIRVQGPH
ncbi:hypothetical protein F2Q69_00000904 [Brassica cretica]|uniref:Uncharacterized protein n=1 Tax=Brassica cretica TaxID=69181 RepID=A0A8S9P2X1_BRACR|nr:hypothetical protein F2Q69_00000904 [Brassica cretica]